MSHAPKSYVITDYGAVADGTTNNAWAIQRTIDACAANGGGRVVIPSASDAFMSGKIFLRSKIELHLEAGARLLCSPEFEDLLSQNDKYSLKQGFLCANGATDISITGSGTLDGNGRSYVAERLPQIYVMKRNRPRTLVFLGCSRIRVTGITVRDGAEWTLCFCGCEDLAIDGISLYNDLKLPNSDGISLDHSRNVRVTNCHVEAGDDAIVLKTTRMADPYGPTENVTVSDCTLKSTSSALVIGCEISAPVRHIVFDSCTISSSHRGLAINLSFESDVEDILFSNMTIETRIFDDRWWGRGEAIYVKALPWTDHDKVGRIHNVRFQNIEARSENGVLVWGQSPDRIEDIAFDNVRLTLEKGSKYPADHLDLRPCPGRDNGYASGVVEHPARAVILHDAQRIALHKFEIILVTGAPQSKRPPMEVENVPGLTLSEFSTRMAEDAPSELMHTV
jgi:polygalacturonase